MKFISLMATMPERRANLPKVRENYLRAISVVAGRAEFEWYLALWPDQLDVMDDLEKDLAPVPFRIFAVPRCEGLICHPFLLKANGVLDVVCREGFDDPDTFICTLMDDDLISKNLLLHLKQAYELRHRRILVVSAARGQQVAQSQHPTWSLLAAPANMHHSYVTASQIWVRADVFTGKHDAPRRLSHDDGLFVQQLHLEHPDWFEFLPDVWVAFNALEPGRWTDVPELKRLLDL